jgi:diacylglycerol kinase (ATP)
MARKFIYFINPISGTKDKTLLTGIIRKRTTEKKIPFEILHTNAAGDYSYLAEKIKTEKITDVIICGGDGTVNQVADAVRKLSVNIGIIPMGSGNGLAFAARIPKSTTRALDVIFAGNSAYVDGFYINKKFSCMLCGLGLDAQVAQDFAKQQKRGLMTYIRQSIKNFISASCYDFELKIGNKTINTKAFFISIANSNQFGNHFTIAPKASLQDGLLDVVVVNEMNKLMVIWTVLRQIRMGKVQVYADKKSEQNNIHYFQTKKITIKNPGLAPLHIDGDPVETAPIFEIEVIEKAFKLLMP